MGKQAHVLAVAHMCLYMHVTVPEQVINLSIFAPVQEGVLTEHTCNKLCQHRRTSQHEPRRNLTPKTCDMKRDELWYNILTWQWQYVYTMIYNVYILNSAY